MASSFFVKCVCPSCLEEIYLGECRIVSGRTSGKVLKEPKGPFARMSVEPLTGPKYTLELARRECTNCAYPLPYNIESVPSLSLVIVGDTFSGKSHYIASLIQQLKTEWLGNAVGSARFTSLTPDEEMAYLRDYVGPLFVERRVLSSTAPSTSETTRPLIYNLVRSPSPRRPPLSLNLVIYDTAGEDFYEARLVQFARFVLNTNALIFVADPFAMTSFAKTLPASLLPNETEYMVEFTRRRRLAERFTSIIEIIERYRGLSSGSSLPDLPIAIMLSKADMLQHAIPASSYRFLHNPYYRDALDLEDIRIVDEEVRDIFARYQQNDLLKATIRLKQVSFFATSATGEAPDRDHRFRNVTPLRCLDPLLWILYRRGVIEAAYK
ncbi:hypothetical protein KSF_065400 [Reticulibacter mediterranei]|uniref:Uncharacterized protein n=1 Tax=Reticulibacter mediterranei TaxID=2778369 RepID=A0A8J3ITF6_9CHLR|nr:hypothetical protein [Reticulibacter mediterranei]GHO96492.1 hypothetical protein KSF_065400 [Reticulibacter mediterranei]